MVEATSDVRARARAVASQCQAALADGQRAAVVTVTANVLAAEEHSLLVAVALGERVRALHELGDIAEARRLWTLVESRLPGVARADSSFVYRLALVGADLSQFGAGGVEAALGILRTASGLLRAHGDAEAADRVAWDAVRRLGYAGRHRDLLTAITTLGNPPTALHLELTVPWSIAEALDGAPRAAADRLSHALLRLDREPHVPPLIEQGIQGALVLTSVWGGEPSRVALNVPRDPWLQSSHALFHAMLAIARLDWREAHTQVERALRMRQEADVTGMMNVVHVIAAQVAAVRGDQASAREHLRARDVADERLSATTRADLDHRSALTHIALGDDPRVVLDAAADRVESDQLALPALWLDHARASYGLPQRFARSYTDHLDRGAPAIAARLQHLRALDGASAAAKQRAAATVAHAGVWLPPNVALSGLTPRQRDVAERLMVGMTNREIASTLHLSVRTVESHVAATMRRLGASTRAEAAEALRSLSPGSSDEVEH